MRWQIGARLNPYPIVYPFTAKSKLLVARGMTGATGNLYCGLHEFAEMGFLLHLLRDTDLFVDVGANVGSYTILASAEVGARTLAVEPVPSTHEILKANISLNGVERLVDARNVGIGSSAGSIRFTRSLDTVNHVATQDEPDTIEVPIETLDNIVGDAAPILVKIDVEGYETEVLRGARRTIANPCLKAVIIELNGSGRRYGFGDNDIHRSLVESEFAPFTYDPFTRCLLPMVTFGPQNTIYMRDRTFVEERVRSAPAITINNHVI